MIYVYYNDDYYDSGGVGLKEFSSIEDAQAFVAERLTSHDSDPDDYMVIDGNRLTVKIKETVKKVIFA